MVSFIRVWNATIPSGPANFGTLTCVGVSRLDRSRYFALGASHVMAPLADTGSSLVPSLSHTIVCRLPSETSDRELGKLLNWSPLYARATGFANEVDAAIVEVDSATAQRIIADLPPFARAGSAAEGDSYSFVGVATAAGAGSVAGPPGPLVMTCRNAHNEFEELQMSGLLPGTGNAEAGDSGALVINNRQEAVGVMLAAGFARNTCYLGDLSVALDYFGLDLVTAAHFGAAPAPAAPVPAGAPAAGTDDTRGILARTLWGEARSETVSGIRAVAAVVLNRAARDPRYWWGGTISEVCLKPYQFSCWNADDPNLRKLQAVTDVDVQFRTCLRIADLAMAAELSEVKLGATHYHTRFVYPSWAKGKLPCAETRGHLFYNNIE
jgi:N-acetylmuramoyl-L-alanine amidase